MNSIPPPTTLKSVPQVLDLLAKTLRKITLLRSQKKNHQAKTLCIELKSDFKTVKQIATITKENVRSVYRLLSSPQEKGPS